MRLLSVPTKSIRPYILTKPRFLATYSLKERFSLYIVQFPFPAAQQLTETQNALRLDGKTWVLAEFTLTLKSIHQSLLLQHLSLH